VFERKTVFEVAAGLWMGPNTRGRMQNVRYIQPYLIGEFATPLETPHFSGTCEHIRF